MTDNFNDYQPNGEAAADRWATALRLFDGARPETPADKWERARLLFDGKEYTKAATLLAEITDESPQCGSSVRMLLARAYYHSAQLGRAEQQLRDLVDRDPGEHYAYLMLGRTLQRQGRHDDAAPWLRMSAAFAGDPID